MNARPPPEPPAALKITIVVGLVTMGLGLIGAIYLRWINPADDPSPEVSVVRLTNVPDDIELQVTATWSERDQTRTEEGRPGTEPGIWSFHLAPVRQSLTLTVWRVEAGARTAWVQRAVAFDRLEPVIVALPKI